jgi:GntR family transcriptional repressor for pyruvate dehydrogenase complex
LEILPGKGTFITNETSFKELSSGNQLINVLNSEPIFDIMEIREILECKCAELAAVRADPEQLKKLEHFNKIMQDNHSDSETISKADLKFHLALAEATNNEVINEIIKLLIGKVELYADKFWATVPRGKEKSISTIDQTYHHVAQGESKKAAQSMREHLRLVKDKLKDVLLE